MARSTKGVAQKETPREPLTRERIAQAALALIDDEGLDGCSMRRLGARLGVEAMAIYHHFKGKGELLDAVMEQLLVGQQLNASLPPLKRLREFMRNQRAVAIAHPRAFILLASRRFNTDFAFALYEQVLAAFAELGLSAKESAFWFRLIGGYVCGAGMAEVASREQVDDATTLLLEHAPERIAYPHVRAIAPHLAVERLEANFELSLDVLFGALAAQVAARQAGD
ncbi:MULTISPECIES: TetR/AcrR family transcriptional regulator [Burkholderia]|jgi:AcrR family transcriptional regulator|uniref:Bacterial regulatory s, tetR family protein n=1 Tax=Burkholderia gladioli TaxID=28095 RepID=A0AAW3EYL0_BURGA|nr:MULTISPECIES: TetR family transcriptional regulator [Burkholderia]AJW95227.1 bacterial regulatory s, tetR family protein [Burkholderia gladioli]ASD82555.1 TetR family transcriptional regulator [Burkholderia gladioli pv. gladioli]AWY49995.1 TetR family transcriptional regulator [Burkholderia gladioli pv. gladioli]KAF1060000.1 Tetracycline repressor protein class D [Burkholderia gladioli]KGC13692.1 bacterial regulatory s, tetR family protein [Burkholderia gladioli]